MEDGELLRDFIEHRSQTAFTLLVRRYIDLVYSAALRQVRDPAMAEDVTQSVFVLLARKAGRIREVDSLAGWLLVATRGIALNAIRSKIRRRHHESEAASMKCDQHSAADDTWQQVRPVLDDAISRLNPQDRSALSLRYFQNCEMPEVAAALGISTSTAHKRVSRAVGRLRELFARRGITTSAEMVSGLLLTHAVEQAPAALTAKVAASALSIAGAISSMPTFKGAAAIMASINTKIAVTAAAAFLLVGAVAAPVVYYTNRTPAAPAPPAQIAQPPGIATSDPVPTPGWEERFKSVYALNADEFAKRLSPPFIPERTDLFNSVRDSMFMREMPTSFLIRWDGQNLRWVSAKISEERNVASVLKEVAGIEPQDTDLLIETLASEVQGDWVIRVDATTQQKIPAVSRALFGADKTLKLVPTEREVIVVSGSLEYKPFAGMVNADTLPNSIQLCMYPDGDPRRANAHAAVQSQAEIFMLVGTMALRPVVIEANLGEVKPAFISMMRRPEDTLRFSKPLDGAALTEAFDVLTAQLGVRFKLERRVVPTWHLAPAGP